MKSILNIFLIAFSFVILSCDGFFEDEAIDVALENAKSRLVVEALINWEKGTTGNNQQILLSQSSIFFGSSKRIPAIGASVRIENTNGDVFDFMGNNDGSYSTAQFEPILREKYTLIINFEGEEIRATETLLPVPDIENIGQDEFEVLGEKIPVVTFTFQDIPEEENFFFFEFFPDFQPEKDTDFSDDEFQDGNKIEVEFSSSYEIPNSDGEIREFKQGDVIDFALFGISEQFYNYYGIINDQADPEGGPFSLPPAQANGNCINITNPDNRPLGYFRLSEVSKASYTYQ